MINSTVIKMLFFLKILYVLSEYNQTFYKILVYHYYYHFFKEFSQNHSSFSRYTTHPSACKQRSVVKQKKSLSKTP